MKRHKGAYFIGALTFLSVAMAVIMGSASANRSDGPPLRPAPSATDAEMLEWEGAYKQWVQRSGNTKHVSGPETAGQSIIVASKGIQLPSDAYVDEFLISITCKPGVSCPQTPVYVLRRGPSTIAVEAVTGRVVHREIAPGQDHAFDFLEGVTQGGETR